MRLKSRSHETELLDAEGVTAAEIAQSYRELGTLHRFLGNTGAILRRLRRPAYPGAKAAASVLDIGCGHGALLVEIRRQLGIEVIGVDLRPVPKGLPVPILIANAVTDPLPRADVAISLMTAHHLTEAEVIAMIRNAGRSCDRLILLDLVRHPIPLLLFRIFVRPFLCPINAQDGQISIRRAFTAAEMRQIVANSTAASELRVVSVRHTVAPFWTRQVVDICWENQAG